MPRITFLDIVKYFESLADKHCIIQDKYRWNASEFSGQLRSGAKLPVMLVDSVETQTQGDKTKTIHVNSTAFTVLGKANTKTGNIDQYEAQNIVLDSCQQICFDIEARIIKDAKTPKNPDGSKNWLYGMVDKNSFHHFKVGPIFSDGLYGYRCEVSLKNQVPTCVDATKWSDLEN